MNSLENVRHFTDNKGLWLAVTDIAKSLGKTTQALTRQCAKSCIELKSSQVIMLSGRKSLFYIHEKDLFQLVTGLRATGEFADSIKNVQTAVINKGLEQVTKQIEPPKRIVKHFQRFPDPIQIPDKPIRACIVEYVRKAAIVLKVDTGAVFKALYTEFKHRYSVDLTKHTGFKSGMERCESLEKLQELYAVARAMFDEYMPEDKIIPEMEENLEKLPSTCS